MGSRILVVVLSILCISGCAAFDSSQGSAPDGDGDGFLLNPGVGTVNYEAYFKGTLTLESNACETIEAEEGSSVDFGMLVLRSADTVNVTFDDGETVSGTLEGDTATFLADASGERRIYYLSFSAFSADFTGGDQTIEGTGEIFEPAAEGEGYESEPCGEYSLTLTKGEKPEALAEEDGEEEDAEGEE